jgi:VWFA-related protein/TonB family protein
MELLYYLADVTARSLCLAALALLGVWLFRVKTAAARHAALTVVSGGMLLLAALTPTLPSIPLRVLRAERAAPVSPAPNFQFEAPSPLTPLAVQPAARQPARPRRLPHFAWPAVASAVYFAVALVLLLRLAYGYLFTRRLVSASRREGEVYESGWISVPMTVGWLRPKILLPAVWKEWDAAKLAAVLAHERTHIRRADWAIAALAALNRSVFWFNPLAWWMERRLALLAEQACDDAALLETGAREPYAEALLDMAAAVRTGHGRMVWEAMAMARTAEVRKRIERILDETRQIPLGLTRRRWAALVACSLPLLYLASVTQLAPAQNVRPALHADFAAPVQASKQAVPVEIAQTAQAAPAAPAGQTAIAPASPGEIKYKDKRLLVLYLDVEGTSADYQIRAQNAAQTFLNAQVTADDLVAVMTYTGELKVLQDFTADRDRLSRTLRSLPVHTSSNDDTQWAQNNQFKDRPLASLESAVKMLGNLPGKKALVYFGGGVPRAGTRDSAQLQATIDAALQANVSFYPVDVDGPAGTAVFQSVVTASAQATMQEAPDLFQSATSLPRLQRKVEPEYPLEVRARGVQGTVLVAVTVGVDGVPKDIRIAQSLDPGLDAAALAAAAQWQFQPARQNGQPVEAPATLQFIFRLQ